MNKELPIALERVKRFEELGLGMFIHWGLYSQLAKGEWTQCIAQIPKEEYVKLFDTFTAKDFDARSITKLAKKAGMKYITLTTRHHEGFSLYDTKGLNEYDAMHSPAGRDLIAEFVTACNEEGILPFFYHTTLDWHNESYNTDFKAYLQYLRDSIEILCTNYGKIGGFWFDGNWDKPDEDWEEDKLYALIRKHQPDAIIMNNTGIHMRGELGNIEIDSVTFEQGRPTPMDRRGMKKYVAAEMSQTMNNHWGIASYDYNYKSVPELIENLCACRKVGANYIINVGPTAGGKILKMQEASIEVIGEWMDIFGEPIYKGKPSEVTSKGKNFALTLGDKEECLFIHDLDNHGHNNVTVSDGGSGPRIFENVTKKIKRITWMDNDEELRFHQDIESGYLVVYATGYLYGKDLVVRVAKVTYE